MDSRSRATAQGENYKHEFESAMQEWKGAFKFVLIVLAVAVVIVIILRFAPIF